MPIEFDKRKEKNLIMMVEKSGVDNDDLNLTFNIDINGVKYGFPCELKENKVIIGIPALDTVVKELEPGKYNATLDITGSGKYFMQPFNEEIEIIDIPEVIVDKESLKETKLFVTVSELIDDGMVKIDEKEIDKPDDFVEEKKKFNIEDVKLTEGDTLSCMKKPSKKKPKGKPPAPNIPKPEGPENEIVEETKIEKEEKKESMISIVSKMFE